MGRPLRFRTARAVALLVAALTLAPTRTAVAAGALVTVAEGAAKGLGAGLDGALVVAAPLVSDAKVERGDELAVRVAGLVAGKLGPRARAHGAALPLVAARGEARRAPALVFVQVAIGRGELRVTADAYAVTGNGWDRVRRSPPAPRAHAFVAAPIDAEVRGFLPPLLLEQASVHKVKLDEPDVLAAACGDVDGDGGLEIAIVSRRRVVLGRLRGGAFVPSAEVAWPALAARAPVPLREPVGGASFAGKELARLLVGTTDRGGVALDGRLAARGALTGIPIGGAGLCAAPRPEASALDAPLVPCDAKDRGAGAEPPAAPFDALAMAEVGQPAGGATGVIAAREPGGKLRVRVGTEDARLVEGVGAQLAVADLDLDGLPELVHSLDGPEDAIRVVTLGPGDARTRLNLPAPGGVRALAACPPEARGAPGLVAVVGNEVWLVR